MCVAGRPGVHPPGRLFVDSNKREEGDYFALPCESATVFRRKEHGMGCKGGATKAARNTFLFPEQGLVLKENLKSRID